jgi:hypothetical protein
MRIRQRLTLVGSAAALLAVIAVVGNRGEVASRAPRILEIEMRASAGNTAQLFWSSEQIFTHDQSVRLSLRPPADSSQRLRFPFPQRGVRWLRFDPIDASGEVSIEKAQILDPNGVVLTELIPEGLRPANQIASITWRGRALHLVTTPGATNPSLLASLGCLDRPPLPLLLTLFTPATMILARVATGLLIIAAFVVIAREAFDRQRNGALSRPLLALWLTALFLIVLSSKLLLMRDHPVTVPFWDQWDAEAAALFVPASECNLTWRSMFSLHNEHRVFFTRLLALDLLAVNRQWDPRFEQVVNAAIHAFTAVLLVTMLWLAGNRRRLDLLVMVSALVFAVPVAWENILLGFQSAFYFLICFSLLALWLTVRHRPRSRPWLLGWACAICGLFTAASGLAAAIAITVVVLLKLMNDRREWREALTNAAAAAFVLALGLAVASPPLPPHAFLKAGTAADFIRAMAQALAWPWVDRAELSIVMWLPVGALLAAALLRKWKTTEFERLVIGLGVWVAVHAALVAYARGAGGAPPATRYMDFLSLGFIVNAMALAAGSERLGVGHVGRRVALGVLTAWLLFGAIGVHRLMDRTFLDLAGQRQMFIEQAATIRRFMREGDLAALLSKRPLSELPYPNAPRLATLLQDLYLRRILPAAVRAPTRVDPQVVTNDAFVEGGTYQVVPGDPLARSWGSFTEKGNGSTGRFESEPIRSCQGSRLKFQIAGYLGGDKQYLAVRDLRTGQDTALQLAGLPRESWVDAFVRCPPGAYSVIASDTTPDTWFAFREPVEFAWASSLVELLIAHSRTLLFISLSLIFLAARRT